MRDSGVERRWAAAAAHRERLLRIARARVPDGQDAEDVVQEALLRSVEFEGLDEERLGRFLTSVTVRLCVDDHRRRAQAARLHSRLGAEPLDGPGADEPVCDHDEAAWVARVVETLPPRQREVLVAKADGMSCGEIGTRFRMSYKAVESALTHARKTVRRAMAASYVLVVAAFARAGWRSRAVAVAAVPAVAAGFVLGVASGPAPDAAPAPPPAVRATAPAAGAAVRAQPPHVPPKPPRARPAPVRARVAARPAAPVATRRRPDPEIARVGNPQDGGFRIYGDLPEPEDAFRCIERGVSVEVGGPTDIHQSCG